MRYRLKRACCNLAHSRRPTRYVILAEGSTARLELVVTYRNGVYFAQAAENTTNRIGSESRRGCVAPPLLLLLTQQSKD